MHTSGLILRSPTIPPRTRPTPLVVIRAAPPGSWRPLTMAGNPGLPTFIAPMIPHIHLNPHRLGFVDTTLTPHILQGADTTLCTVAQAGSWR